ncbi:MAG: gliding motility protein GldN [Prevotella sp.]|nr:gliding motility protein GldN [Prevotella sp.]
MKKILFLFLLLGMVQGIWAQPEARRQAAAQKKAAQQNGETPTLRAQISFPTALLMDEDVVWRRDIYRELDLNNEANAALYYPVEPKGNQMNLFTTIFRLMMTGKITVFQYRMDGNESFAAADRVDPKSFLDNYHIYYEKQANGRIKLDNSDIPSREVKSYYIKESSFFDQRSATFHTKVLALCPIMTREDDFGDGGTKFPLFWVKYDDLAPYLTRQQVMTSNLNNAVVMSIDDYFARNQYKGKIYKTNNLLGQTLSQYCTTDSAMAKEQKRIEAELVAFEKNIWGNQARKDSLDSIANAAKDVKGSVRKNRRSTGLRGAAANTGKVSRVKPKQAKNRTSSASGSARVTVRRERH